MTIPAAVTAIATAQTAVAALGELSLDSDAAPVRFALAAVTTAQATLLTLRDEAEADMAIIIANAATAAAANPGVVYLVASAADLTEALLDTGDLAALTQAEGYLGRAAINLGGDPWV